MANPDTEKLQLVRRIKLDFTVHQYGPRAPVKILHICSALSTCMKFQFHEINVPETDIHLKPVPEKTDHSGKRRLVLQGTLFLRDLRFIPDWVLETGLPRSELIGFLQQGLSRFRLNLQFTGSYEVRAFRSVWEDADQMMAAPRGSTHEPPTIIIKGVPSQWFADQPDSSQPSNQRLLAFFQNKTFGKIRDLDTTTNEKDATYCDVAIQYENNKECYKALKRLCSYSLQKVDRGGSKVTADYELTWKDSLESALQEENLNGSSCEYSGGLASKQVSLAPNSQDVSEKYQALQLEMAVLREQFKSLEARVRSLEVQGT